MEDVNVIFLEIFPEISKGRQIDSGIKDAFVAEKGVSEEEVATAVERTQHLLQIVSSILYISIVLSGLEYPVGKMLYLVSSAIYLFLFLEDGQRKISKPIARHLVPVINTLNFYKKRKDFEKNFSSREKKHRTRALVGALRSIEQIEAGDRAARLGDDVHEETTRQDLSTNGRQGHANS